MNMAESNDGLLDLSQIAGDMQATIEHNAHIAAPKYETRRYELEAALCEIMDNPREHFTPGGDVVAGQNIRPERNAVTSEVFQDSFRRLMNLGVFNTDYEEKDNGALGLAKGHLTLSGAPEIEDTVVRAIKEAAGQGKIRVILPFVDELQARINVKYAADLVGSENVVVIEAGVQDPKRQESRVRAIIQVQQENAEVNNQRQVLERIPWRQLREAGIIRKPEQYPKETDEQFKERYAEEIDSPPKGAKGLTLLSASLLLYSRDAQARQLQAEGKPFNAHDILADDTMIAFHDTDIGNPTLYRALEHMIGYPLAFQPPGDSAPFLTGQIARMGRGRNNESIAGQVNHMVNFPGSPLERQLGVALQSVIWHMTGERWIRWDELKNMPFTPGMTIESMFNFYAASRAIETGYETRAQVPVVYRKKEHDPISKQEVKSIPDREWDMMYMLELFYSSMAQFTNETGKLPSQWDIQDISRFNETFGGMFSFLTVNGPFSDEDAGPKVVSSKEPKAKQMDPILPSLQMLFDEGYLPVEEISSVEPHKQVQLNGYGSAKSG